MTNTDWNDLTEIGFWYSSYEPHFPHPKDHVGEWDPVEMTTVVEYLKEGYTDEERYRGMSYCRICGSVLGNCTYTDGVYAWPQELEHYLLNHSVRLPDEFIQHVMAKSE